MTHSRWRFSEDDHLIVQWLTTGDTDGVSNSPSYQPCNCVHSHQNKQMDIISRKFGLAIKKLDNEARFGARGATVEGNLGINLTETG